MNIFSLYIVENIFMKCPGSHIGMVFVLIFMCASAPTGKCFYKWFTKYIALFMPVSVIKQLAMVASLCVNSSILCEEGLWRQGRSAAEREVEGHESWSNSNFQAEVNSLLNPTDSSLNNQSFCCFNCLKVNIKTHPNQQLGCVNHSVFFFFF